MQNDSRKTKDQLIEELRRAEGRIRELEREAAIGKRSMDVLGMYEFIVNTSREFQSLIDSHHRYVAVNDSYSAALNLDRKDIVGRLVSEIWGEDQYRAIIKRYLDECFSGKSVHYVTDFEFASLGHKTMEVKYYPYRDSLGAVTHVVVLTRDITEETAAEKQLLALKTAVETMQLGVTISNTDGKIIYSNPAEARMHGVTVEDLIGSDVKGFAPNTLWKPRIIKALNETTRWRRESVNLRKDGTVFPVQLMSDVVKGSDGLPIGIVTTCEDITERKRTEERIRSQIERLTILSEIDSVILSSMDLKVILNVLLNHLVDRLNVHAALVMRLNPHTLTLEYADARGFASEAMNGIKLKLGQGLAGQVALERRPIISGNIMEGAKRGQLPAFLQDENIQFYCGFPLVAKGQVKGTLEIFHRSDMNPDSEWMNFIEALAGQAAIAIDNSTMFADLQRSNTELALAYDTTLDGWSRALDLRDKETEGHSERVTELTIRIARMMGIAEVDLVHVRRGALLHDIGKMGVPDCILLKPGALNDEEWSIMKLHPVYAYEMLSPIRFLRPALLIPYCHHEKWDGTGYPRGLRGEQIPVEARIFALVDVLDALRSDRPYRRAWSRDKTREHIISLSGKHFDPKVVEAYLSTDL